MGKGDGGGGFTDAMQTKKKSDWKFFNKFVHPNLKICNVHF